MTRIIEDLEAHYETLEVPFGRIYEWHAEQIIIECNCGERFALAATTPTTACQCGTDHGAIIRDIQMREGRLPDKTIHPWHHDAQEQTEQHRQDETAYPEGSPWRYNDITSGNTNGE
jgi:hypothetical protein